MIASLRNAFIALILGALAGPVLAASEVPNLKANHPSRYIVQTGDTLWDISGRFLDQPWRWPDVWQANPQIENPHLIFPGDEVMLTYKDGRPIIRVRRRGRRGVKHLSPAVRSESLAKQAIPTIPVDAIEQFLARPRVVSEAEYEAAPYILSLGREALIARPGGKIYVRGIDDERYTRYSVYRKGHPYIDPDGKNADDVDGKGELLGYEALHVADAVVDIFGDPVTMVITNMYREVLEGDRLVRVDEEQVFHHYQPRPASDDMSGQIISVVDGVTQIGQFQTVVLNRGTKDGLEAGHVFAVYQNGGIVEDKMAPDPEVQRYEERAQERESRLRKIGDTPPDAIVHGFGNLVEGTSDFIGREARRFEVAIVKEKPWAEVQLPDERAGTIMVFRSFERLSYALVLEASRAMHVTDTVKKP